MHLYTNFESFGFTYSFCVLVNLYNDCCHIVTAKSLARGNISGAAIIQKQSHGRLKLRQTSLATSERPLVQFLSHEIDSLLTRLDVPDAIAGKEDELGVAIDRLDGHVGEGRNGLFGWLKRRIALVLEVT